ncbi:hypothetical protein KR044_008258, partial [Drosophila immigrans]
ITVDMDIEGKVITAKVYVADDDLIQEDFLLGQDVIISAHLTLNFEPYVTEVKRAVQQQLILIDNAIEKLLVNFQNDQERGQKRILLERFPNVFSTGLQDIGKTNLVQAHIIVESGQTVSQAPYRVSEPKKEVVCKMVDELLEQDIITLSTSEYAI